MYSLCDAICDAGCNGCSCSLRWPCLFGQFGSALLDGAINLNIPIKLLQGLDDNAVPKQWPERIVNCLTSNDVEITLVKGTITVFQSHGI